MELVKQSAEILTINGRSLENFDGMKMLQYLEKIGRTCYKSEDKIGDEEKTRQFVRKILKSGHHSVIEHLSMAVRFITNRGTTHEMVRHRLAQYSQESTRFCNYGSAHVKFVIPHWCTNVKEQVLEPDTYIKSGEGGVITDAENIWVCSMKNVESAYKILLKFGVSPQDARGVLPIDLKTEIVMTANLREWRHVFSLRAAPAAHPQIRQLMQGLLDQVKALVPVLFDDIGVKE